MGESNANHHQSDTTTRVPPVRLKRVSPLQIVFIVLVVAAVVGGVAWLLGRQAVPKATKPTTTATVKPVEQSPITSATKQYSSVNFNLTLEYPADWTVSDVDGASKLTVTSPALQLKSASGQSVTGQVIFALQNPQPSYSQFAAGSATAVIGSQKISYASPTPSQRAQTYVSFLSYATTKASNALDAVYVTGDFGYQKDQYIPQTDVVKANPLVTLSFVKCANDKCSGANNTSLSIAASSWQSLSKPLLHIIESLQLE